MSTNRVKRQKDLLRELLALRTRHAQSARACDVCGEKPLAHDPLARMLFADPDTGEACAGCVALLESVEADYLVMMPARGIADDPDEAAA